MYNFQCLKKSMQNEIHISKRCVSSSVHLTSLNLNKLFCMNLKGVIGMNDKYLALKVSVC